MRIIHTEDDLAEGAAWLARVEPRFERALAMCKPLPLRRQADGFRALLSAISSQQLSVASANAIWARMDEGGYCEADALMAASDDDLRACGFSRQKITYARALAEARLDYAGLRVAPAHDVIAELVAIKGIGTWTAEIYAMFSLGHADVFAAGDLALQESARMLFELDARPKEKDMRKMAERWSPWRAVAARLLWAYYRIEKQREGVR